MLILSKLERLGRRYGQKAAVNLRWISAPTMYDTPINKQKQEEGKALLMQEIEKINGTNSVQEMTAI